MSELSKPTINLSLVNNNLTVSWNAVSGATEYEVWRDIDDEGFTLIATVTDLSFLDQALPSDKVYKYYVTAVGEDKSYTIAFNEKGGVFSSFFDYKPSIYINKGFKLISTNPDNNKLYEHFKGDFTTFYDVKYPMYITLQINPAADLECVFNNIEFNSELYINDIDQPSKTLTHLQVWNEYQDSGRKALSLGIDNNLRRKFRSWRAKLPRESGTRNRIRSPWCFLTLELDTTDNSKIVLHDINLYYTV